MFTISTINLNQWINQDENGSKVVMWKKKQGESSQKKWEKKWSVKGCWRVVLKRKDVFKVLSWSERMGSQSESHRSKTIEMSNLLSFVSIAINIGCDSKYLLHLIIMFFCTSKVSILLTYHHYINKWKAKHTFVKSGPSSAKHLTNNHLAFKSWLTYNYFHQSFIQCFLSLFKVTSRGQRNSFLPKSVSPIFFLLLLLLVS